MAKIAKINSIKNCRSFIDFTWPSDGSEIKSFTDYNLIYGWNGTGKTTIADIFRDIERKQLSFSGSYRITLDDNKAIDSNNIKDAISNQLQIRVFNRAYIVENIFTVSGEITPIFFLGKENKEKQEIVEEKTKGHKEETKNLTKLNEEIKSIDTALEALKVKGAKAVKAVGIVASGTFYQKYDKRNFGTKIDAMTATGNSASTYTQNVEELERLRQRFNEQVKDQIPIPTITLPNLDSLYESTISILEQTIVTSAINALKNNEKLSTWVKEGLDIHKHESYKDCQFCNQPLTEVRIKILEAHFNHEYNSLIEKIAILTKEINLCINTINTLSISFPSKEEIVLKWRSEYVGATSDANEVINSYLSFLSKLVNELRKKNAKPFQCFPFYEEIPINGILKLERYIKILEQHNLEYKNHSEVINNAATKYEEAIVANDLDEYKQLTQQLSDTKMSVSTTTENISKLINEIETIEKEIKEHHKASEQLNKDLTSYLGHEELKFESKENGYVIYRSKKQASIKELSEGEKTAIALLYFLSSLKDKSFDNKGIVVIDDPVCSLDESSLFHAFAYIQERTKDVQQLFILTHNFAFFRQVKKWFQNIIKHEKPKKANFYQTIKSSTKHGSEIKKLDNLLEDYESEYHYLFKLMYVCSKQSTSFLGDYYHMPNVARRVMESFFAFKYPQFNKSGSLLRLSLQEYEKDGHENDKDKRHRWLKFLHAYSHFDNIDAQHDATSLSKTKEILTDLLCVIEKTDKVHHDGIVDIIKDKKQLSKVSNRKPHIAKQ